MDNFNDFDAEFQNDYENKNSFDSLEEIEEALMRVSSIDKKLEWYKNLKRNRLQSIDDSITQNEQRREHIENLIMNTMSKLCPKEKTIHFPSVGKVTKRALQPEVKIEDDTAFLKFIEEKGLRDKVMKEEFNKTMAKNVVKEMIKEDENTNIPGVKVEKDRTSLSISFEKEEESTEQPSKTPTPKKVNRSLSEMVV